MAADIRIIKHNEVFNTIQCERSIAYELSDKFTFKVPNYKFHPKYRIGIWDGNIRLFNVKTRELYAGLTDQVKEFAKDNEYELETFEEYDTEFSIKEARDFIDTLKMPKHIELRDYQVDTFVHCVRKNRCLFLSPTSSGKSLMIYWLLRYYKRKTLIIVDSINLLNQLYSDFEEYGFNSEKNIHKIFSGQEKTSKKPIYITTWQSAAKQSKSWFDQFELTIGDEAHKYKATSLKKIMENLTKCKLRFGFTGSLDGSLSNQMVLEGLFGPLKQIVTTKELIDMKYLSTVEIKSLILNYSDEDKKIYSKVKYQDELKFIYSNKKRMRFINNLALSLKGNTLILFHRVDEHGIPMYEQLLAQNPNPTYLVHGKVEGDEREEIRKIVNTHENSITVASVGTFSTGVNIPNINNMIFTAPSKAIIRTIQSIGRGLRKSDVKDHCVIFDIADDLSWKKKQNYTMKHYAERIKIYSKEQHPYKIYRIELK